LREWDRLMHGLVIPVIHGASPARLDEVDTLRTAKAIVASLRHQGAHSWTVWIHDGLNALPGLDNLQLDLLFNLVEAIDGDDLPAAYVPGELDRLGLPYTGCGKTASLAWLSKPEGKRALVEAGLPTPDWSEDGLGFSPSARVIIKSMTDHASLGLDDRSVVSGAAAKDEILLRERRFKSAFFAESYIEGREFNLSILDGGVLPPGEILFDAFPSNRPKIVDYEAKWEEGTFAYDNTPRRFSFDADDADLIVKLRTLALECWSHFALTGYARVDFRVDTEGCPYILEINSNPCLAPDAGFVAAAAEAGMDFDAVIARIVTAARRDNLSRVA
jgi:D-alanine-D-alanine ligase